MSSTLPRTRSLGGSDTRSLTRDYKRNNIYRPSSLCEANVHGICPLSPELEERLRRTPSQANNLSTTVPTSIVNKKLGGRHAPTRSSLRHSRMALMARTVGAGATPFRTNGVRYRRISAFVAAAVIFVGLIDVLLAAWLLHWVPALTFVEVPHYPGLAIITSAVLSVFAFQCELRDSANCRKILQGLVVLSLIISGLSCLSVCFFDMIHLINLAPMECGMKNDAIVHSTTEGTTQTDIPISSTLFPEALKFNGSWVEDDDIESEGSGMVTSSFLDDEDLIPVQEDLEIETATLTSFRAKINNDIYINFSVCVCYEKDNGWKVGKEYPQLSCEEVKNHVPIFLVASCVLMVTGAVLSGVLIYLIYTVHKYTYSYYKPKKNSEIRPFIYKSNFKSMDRLAVNFPITFNGAYDYR